MYMYIDVYNTHTHTHTHTHTLIGLGQARVCKDLSLSFFSIPADFAGPCLATPLLLGLFIGALGLVFWQTFSKVLSIVT
jgi:hypothetical protein